MAEEWVVVRGRNKDPIEGGRHRIATIETQSASRGYPVATERTLLVDLALNSILTSQTYPVSASTTAETAERKQGIEDHLFGGLEAPYNLSTS